MNVTTAAQGAKTANLQECYSKLERCIDMLRLLSASEKPEGALVFSGMVRLTLALRRYQFARAVIIARADVDRRSWLANAFKDTTALALQWDRFVLQWDAEMISVDWQYFLVSLDDLLDRLGSTFGMEIEVILGVKTLTI